MLLVGRQLVRGCFWLFSDCCGILSCGFCGRAFGCSLLLVGFMSLFVVFVSFAFTWVLALVNFALLWCAGCGL